MRPLIAALLLVLAAAPALARDNYALIVAASEYPSLDPKYWLKGPKNDAELVRTFLETNPTMPFEPENVTVLADGVAGGTAPTLAAIRAALAGLAAKAGPGDFVYLHFSGHGSQAPALDPAAELDGLDELFLPVDIGPWSDQTGHVENALVDDEIGIWIDAIRAGGADVWAVFDSCHSGTVTRAAPTGDDEVAFRQLPGEALGIPAARLEEAAEDAATRALPDPQVRPEPPLAAGSGKPGSFVAFFAAQTDETTPEKNMPKGGQGRKPQGVFTYTLFEALAEHPGITYRQLGQEVLRRYAVKSLTRTTPMFEGDLDRVVFGGTGAGRVAQWPLKREGERIVLDAGRLHGIEEGARLAVMASPADPTEAALGFVTVTRTDIFRSEAVPEGLAVADLPKGAFLRKLGDQIDFTLTVALPDGGGAPAEAMRAAAGQLADEGQLGPRVRFVEPGAEADLRLAVLPASDRPDAIWILPASGLAEDLERTPSVSTADKSVGELAEAMGDTLRRMARALNLMKLGGAGGEGTLAVEAGLTRARFDPATEEVDTTARGPLDTANVPLLVPNDVIGLQLTNTTEGPVDYNILYVGSDWSITFIGNGRMLPGARLDEDFVLISDTAFGRDRLVVVLTPAGEQTAVEDLGFLAQDAIDTVRGGPEEGGRDIRGILDGSAAASDFETLIAEAGFGETTRAAVGLSKKKKGPAPVILQFEIDTVPGG